MMMAHLFSLIYGVSFILIGLSHLREPQKFVDIVPSYLPYALFLVYLTGIMEIAGGIGIIYPETRKITGRLLVIFLIAVFPANIYMWTHDIAFNRIDSFMPDNEVRLPSFVVPRAHPKANRKRAHGPRNYNGKY